MHEYGYYTECGATVFYFYLMCYKFAFTHFRAFRRSQLFFICDWYKNVVKVK